jgi:hypothetical protein
MKNCHKSITGYHNQEVTLRRVDRTEMRDRRNANRDRLVGRLTKTEKPVPEEFIKQGSYAMLYRANTNISVFLLTDYCEFLRQQ